MASKDIRMILVSDEMARIVDRGAEVDESIKKLTSEDKDIKTKITEVAAKVIACDEASVRLEGKAARAMVSSVEKAGFDVSAARYAEMRDAWSKGLLEGVVESRLTLTVPPGEVEKAAAALKVAGIPVTVSESLSVKMEDVRKLEETWAVPGAHAVAFDALRACLVKEVSYRVKYEKR